jgi:hypothetical protein
MKKSTHKTAHPAKNAQINRTNLFLLEELFLCQRASKN